MSRRLIFGCCLLAMLALLCARFVFYSETQSSGGPAPANLAGSKLSPSIPSSKREANPPRESAPNDVPSQKLKARLFAGGRPWGLDFADKSLPIQVRQRIGYDLNLVFSHLTEFEIDKLPFPIEVDGKQFDRRVRFEGGTNRRPKILVNSGFAHLEVGAEESSLFVPKSVIDAYIKAIELEKRNQTAYQQLDQFLAQMSDIKVRPVEDVHSLFVVADNFKSAEADLASIPASEFADAWGGKRYREVSILDVAETAGTPFEKYGSLVATTYTISESKADELPPLVFSNGRWRFLLQRPPT